MPQLIIIALFLLATPFYRDLRKWALHAYLFSIPVNLPIFKNTMTTADLFLGIMVFIILADFCLGYIKPGPLDWLTGSVLIFGAAILLSIIGAEYKYKALHPLGFYLKAVSLYFYILNYVELHETGDFFWIFILSGFIPAIFGILTDWGAVRGLAENNPYYLRAVSTFSGPVEFGYQMAIRAAVLFALPWRLESFRLNVLKIGLLFIFLLSVAISFTRNSYIAVILSLMIVITIRGWDMIKRRGIGSVTRFVVPAVLIGFLVWSILPHRIISRLGMLRLGGIDPSIYVRPQLWGAAWKMFLDHPIVGVGFGSFYVMFTSHYVPPAFPQYAKLVGLVSAHNLIFQTLSELGVVGMISLGILIGSYGKAIVRFLTKVDDPWKGYLLTCVSLGFSSIVFGLFDFVWVQERTATSMGFLLALMVLAVNAAQERIMSKSHIIKAC
jgi:O-antigen ligase